MSGGHFNYKQAEIESILYDMSNDFYLKAEFPLISALLSKIAKILPVAIDNIDDHISGDARIENEKEFQLKIIEELRKAIRGVEEAVPPVLNIFLDDIRVEPEYYDLTCKSAAELINIIDSGLLKNRHVFISFDHDLGRPEQTGYTVAKLLEERAYNNELNFTIDNYAIHSSNPVGKTNIKNAMDNAIKYQKQHKFPPL